MLKIKLLYFGASKANSPEEKILQEYEKRLPHKLDHKQMKDSKNISNNLDKELDGFYSVALDETGESVNSVEFSKIFDNSKVAFLIGPSEGINKEFLKKFNRVISFGKLTWPHKLVRPMLMEQIYRAYTIRNNHPYNK